MAAEVISRILSKSEIEQLDSLLVPHLSKKYPNFEKWLDKAKKEIEEGVRFAFGGWISDSLISTVILRPTISNTVELKSLFVDPKFQKIGHGSRIYEVAEEQCLKMGFHKIIVDAFCEEDDIIIFLINHRYKIYGREDLYGVGKFSYLLSKDLKPVYTGDPFDWEEIASWLIEKYFGFQIVERHPVIEERALDLGIKKTINEKFNILGLVEVKDTEIDQDPVSVLYQKTLEAGYHMPIFIGRKFKKRAVSFANKKGVVLIDERDIYRITGWKPPEIKKEEISGIILPIKPEFYEKILRKGLKQFVYFKGAPFGKFLKKRDKVVFYVESPRKEISAFGVVVDVSINTPEKQWSKFNKESVFKEEEFWRFAMTKKEILAIKLTGFKEINPLDEKTLKNIIPQKMLSGSYIDTKTIKKLIGNQE
ncbi:MAG: GNAT family N-acetyltransferase [Candidatus Hydrothermarchaeota archaeon]|nr:GNAT family N-acetyltransferase [Candidatus Hydrothermarchaeota archaeon]